MINLKQRYPQIQRNGTLHFFFLTSFILAELISNIPTIIFNGWGNIEFFQNSFSSLVLLAFTFLYTFFRVKKFHPALNSDYLNWLKTVPWIPGNRLPLGEVQFVIPDFLYLGMMTLILRIVGQISPWYAPITMLGSFAIFMMYPQYKLGYLFDIFISTMLLGTIPLVHQRPETVFIFSLAAYVMNVVSLRKSLKSLHHWKFGDNLMLKIGKDAKDHLENLKNDKSILGWPWEIMSPAIQNRIDQKSLSLPQAAYMSIAITYLFWATSIGAKTEAILFSPFFLIVLAAAQLEQRIGLRTPPNNLLSRFTTGKLIIKGYDQILITPILFFLILIPYFHLIFSLSQILSMRGPQPSVTLHICAIAGVFFLLLLLALAGPPTNARWILTGKYNPQAKTLFSNRVKYKECR